METDDDLLDYNSRSSSGSASGSASSGGASSSASESSGSSVSTRSPSSSSSRNSSSTRSPSSSSSRNTPSSSGSGSSSASGGSSGSTRPSSPKRGSEIEAGEAIVDTTVYQDTIVYHDVYETEVHDSVEVKQATHTTSATANVAKTENIQENSVNYKMGTATEDGIAEVTLITPPVDLKRLAAQSFAEGVMSIVTAPHGFIFGNIRGRVANSIKRRREAAFEKTVFIKTAIDEKEINIDEVNFGKIDDNGYCNVTLSYILSRDKTTSDVAIKKVVDGPQNTHIEITLAVKTGVFGDKDVMKIDVRHAYLLTTKVGWASGGGEGKTSIYSKNMNARLKTDIRGDNIKNNDRFVCDLTYTVDSKDITYENLMGSVASTSGIKSGSMSGVL